VLTLTTVDLLPSHPRLETAIRRVEERGPFDIIGDIHGCASELEALLRKLGYEPERDESQEDTEPGGLVSGFVHPLGRRAIFLGDLVDRGPRIPQVLKWVMAMVNAGRAFCVPGNHDIKLVRKLQGKDVAVKHGLAESLNQLSSEPEQFRQSLVAFFDHLPSHLVLDDGRLVVAHAGVKETMHGFHSPEVRHFALYGETTGEIDQFGLPVRCNWAADYQGDALVIYGHTPVPEAVWLNRTVNIDTGCVYGGKLTALRYPEREFLSVRATRPYAESKRPFLPAKTG
jgi:protein phosphatase